MEAAFLGNPPEIEPQSERAIRHHMNFIFCAPVISFFIAFFKILEVRAIESRTLWSKMYLGCLASFSNCERQCPHTSVPPHSVVVVPARWLFFHIRASSIPCSFAQDL